MNTLNIYLGTLRSDNTKKSYGKDLRYMLSYINKEEDKITIADLLDWVNHMKESNNSTATIARSIFLDFDILVTPIILYFGNYYIKTAR